MKTTTTKEQIQTVLKSLNILTYDQKMFLREHYINARPIGNIAKAYSISEEEAIKLGNSLLKDILIKINQNKSTQNKANQGPLFNKIN